MTPVTPIPAFFGGGIGPTELLVIGIIAVLLFGKRLPEIGRSLGKSLVEFRKGMHETQDDLTRATGDQNHTNTSPPTQG